MGPTGSSLRYVAAVLYLLAVLYTPSSSAQLVFEPHGTLASTRRDVKHGSSSSNIVKVNPSTKLSPPATRVYLRPPASVPIKPVITVPSTAPTTPPGNSNATKIEVCLDCVTFMQNNLQTLIEIITRIGITDTCAKICSELNSTLEIAACNALCDTVGVEKFWQMFVSAGINPIWACEMLDACTVGEYPAVNFISAVVSPPSGPIGTTFEFKMQFTVVNETGVGETAFVVYYPDNSDHQLGFIAQQVFPDYMPGTYEVSMPFPTNSSFSTGRYIVVFDLCSGACGFDPDPYPFACEEYAFNITGVTL